MSVENHVLMARQPDEVDQILGQHYRMWVREGQLEGNPHLTKDKYWTAEFSWPATPAEIQLWNILRSNWRTIKIMGDDVAYKNDKIAELLKFKQDTLTNQYGSETVEQVELA